MFIYISVFSALRVSKAYWKIGYDIRNFHSRTKISSLALLYVRPL